jgi:hypothetical protein
MTFQSNEFWPLKLFSKNLGIHWDSNSQMGSPHGSVWGQSLTFSYTLRSMKCDSRASLLVCTFASPCLVPKARVATWSLLTCLNSHIKIIHVETTITFHWIEAGNSSSWPNNEKHGEKHEREDYQLNLYPITSNGSCKSQSWIRFLWRSYFRKPCFIIYTIHSTNLLASNGLMKSCDDQSMFFHTTLKIPREILYLG